MALSTQPATLHSFRRPHSERNAPAGAVTSRQFPFSPPPNSAARIPSPSPSTATSTDSDSEARPSKRQKLRHVDSGRDKAAAELESRPDAAAAHEQDATPRHGVAEPNTREREVEEQPSSTGRAINQQSAPNGPPPKVEVAGARATPASAAGPRRPPHRNPSDTWSAFSRSPDAPFSRKDLIFSFRPAAQDEEEKRTQRREWQVRDRSKKEIDTTYDKLLQINSNELEDYHFRLPTRDVFGEMAPFLPEWVFNLSGRLPSFRSPLDSALASAATSRHYRYTYLWTADCDVEVAAEVSDRCDDGYYDHLAAAKACVAAFEHFKLGLAIRVAEAEAASKESVDLCKYVGWGASAENLPNQACRALQHLDDPSSLFAVLLHIVRDQQKLRGPSSVNVHLSFVTSTPFSQFPHGLDVAMFFEAVLAVATRATPSRGAGNVLACGKIDAVTALRDYLLALDAACPLELLPAALPSLRTIVLNGAERHGWTKVSDAIAHYVRRLSKEEPVSGCADTADHEDQLEAEEGEGAGRLPTDLQLAHRSKVLEAAEEDAKRRLVDSARFAGSTSATPLSELLKEQLPKLDRPFPKTWRQHEEERFYKERQKQLAAGGNTGASSGARASSPAGVSSDSGTGPASGDYPDASVARRYRTERESIASLCTIIRDDFGYGHLLPTLMYYENSPSLFKRIFCRLGARLYPRQSVRLSDGPFGVDNLFVPEDLFSEAGAPFEAKVSTRHEPDGRVRQRVVIAGVLVGVDGTVASYVSDAIAVDLAPTSRSTLRLRFDRARRVLELLTNDRQSISSTSRPSPREWTLLDLRANSHSLRPIAVALSLPFS